MKFKEYMKEQLVRQDIFESMWTNIESDCSQYIKELKKMSHKKVLWRGGRYIRAIKKIKPHKNREPKDMPYWLHENLDNMFEKQYGWRPRSEGVFVISDQMDAADYGDPNIFFPFDGYKYLWNPKIGDLFSEIDDRGYGFEDIYEYEYEHEYEHEYSENQQGSWYYDGIDMETNNKYDALTLAAEAEGIDGDELDPTLFEWVPEVTFDEWIEQKRSEFFEERDEWIEKTIKGYKNKNLKKAIDSGVEIMFKCKYYYLISFNFMKFVKTKIWGK